MSMLKTVIYSLMGMMVMSVALVPARADDGHGRGFDQGAFHAQRGDRGDQRQMERRTNRGDQRQMERRTNRSDQRQMERRVDRGDQRRMERRVIPRDSGRRPGYVLDRRYQHDHYYPPRGYFQRELPRGYMTFRHRDERYFYRDGIWYRHSGLGFIVVMPPFGMVVPVLPPYYTTVWVGGIPYYYANGIYYVWQPAQQGYVISEPPAASNVVTQPRGPDQFYVYPKQGQSTAQQEKDRYECHRWAVGQTGFDPSQSVGNLTDSQLTAKRADYRRAIEACLDARGYSVK